MQMGCLRSLLMVHFQEYSGTEDDLKTLGREKY